LAIDTIKTIELLPSEEISVIYNKLKNTAFTNYYIKKYFSNIPVEIECSDSDDFFQQFMFKPKNPEMYHRYGYRKNEKEISYDDIERELDKIVNT